MFHGCLSKGGEVREAFEARIDHFVGEALPDDGSRKTAQ
jgi:hypothetical protein